MGDRYCLRRPTPVAGSSPGQALRPPRLRTPLRAALRLTRGSSPSLRFLSSLGEGHECSRPAMAKNYPQEPVILSYLFFESRKADRHMASGIGDPGVFCGPRPGDFLETLAEHRWRIDGFVLRCAVMLRALSQLPSVH